jgi:zinc and cadmium transporter
MVMVYYLLAASLVATSLLSGLGALFLALNDEKTEALTPYLISLSAGTIFGGVFIHLIYKLAGNLGYTRLTGLLVLFGLAGSLILERLVHWHCHNQDHHVEAFSYVLVAGDAVHNVLDGILITSSFLVGTSAGFASTVAVMAHKIPKEAGDFGILVESGFSQRKAVGFNIAINLFMFVGSGAVILLSTASSGINALLLPLVIGNFVYIAGADLLPRFKEDEDIMLHLLMFGLGAAIMYAIPFMKNSLIS